MAARLNRHHTDQVLGRIKLSNLVTRLQQNALGELKNRLGESIEMSDGQIRSTVALMDRLLPKAEATRNVNLSINLADLIAKAQAK